MFCKEIVSNLNIKSEFVPQFIQALIEIMTRYFEGKARPASKGGSLIANYETTIANSHKLIGLQGLLLR
jgi:hypothetical protein